MGWLSYDEWVWAHVEEMLGAPAKCQLGVTAPLKSMLPMLTLSVSRLLLMARCWPSINLTISYSTQYYYCPQGNYFGKGSVGALVLALYRLLTSRDREVLIVALSTSNRAEAKKKIQEAHLTLIIFIRRDFFHVVCCHNCSSFSVLGYHITMFR